jgi:hypothetical protein
LHRSECYTHWMRHDVRTCTVGSVSLSFLDPWRRRQFPARQPCPGAAVKSALHASTNLTAAGPRAVRRTGGP